jgi:hypothetical protein
VKKKKKKKQSTPRRRKIITVDAAEWRDLLELRRIVRRVLKRNNLLPRGRDK